MKIVVLDGYTENPGDLSWDALKELGDVTVYDRTSYEESPLIAELSVMQRSLSSTRLRSPKRPSTSART